MRGRMTNAIWTRVISAIAEALGCFFLYYGAVMLLLVPQFPAEHYLVWGRVVYGILPIILSVALLTLAGWLWRRAGGSLTLGTYIKRAFLGAVGLVVLLWAVLVVIAHLQGRIP